MMLGNQDLYNDLNGRHYLFVLRLRFNGQYNNSGQCHDDYCHYEAMCVIGHFLRNLLRPWLTHASLLLIIIRITQNAIIATRIHLRKIF